MKIHVKPIVVVISGSILLCQAAHAQLDISGSSILEDVYGATSGPEALTLDWSVVQTSPGGIYTYTYYLGNPTGDELLSPPTAGSPYGTPDGQPEVVDKFTLSLGATILSQAGAANESFLQDAYATWSPNFGTGGIAAGTTNGPLTLTSDFGPSPGDAQASDNNPPSGWSLDLNGEAVPVPGTGNFVVPDSASTMSLLGGMMLLLPFCSSRKKAVRK